MYITSQSDDSLAGKDIASMDMPKVIFGLLLFLCCTKLVDNLIWWEKNRNAGNDKKVDRRVYFTMTLIIGYAVLFNIIGFCLSTFLFVTMASQILRPSNSWKKSLLIAIMVTAGGYIIFGELFGVYFPEPILELIAG
jgi:hypothetical protein